MRIVVAVQAGLLMARAAASLPSTGFQFKQAFDLEQFIENERRIDRPLQSEQSAKTQTDDTLVHQEQMRFLQDSATFTFDASQFNLQQPTKDSKDCTKNCIAKGDKFCRSKYETNEGICCLAGDDTCQTQGYDFCSTDFTFAGMKWFACPYEDSMCGPNPQMTLPRSGTLQIIQSRGGFTADETCYYWLQAMPSVENGDLVYVRFMSMTNVDTFVSIKNDINEPDDIICNVKSGDTILIRQPQKLFMSFKAQQADSKFFIQSFYAVTATQDEYVNSAKCSDQGKSLGNLGPQTGGGGGTTGGGGGQPVTFDPTVSVLAKSIRKTMISEQSTMALTEEIFSEPEAVKNDDTTFRILLLVVGALLIVVAVLMLANTYVTRKHLQANMESRDRIRLAVIQNRQDRERNQESSGGDDGSESVSESEEQDVEVVDQMNRIRAINSMIAHRGGDGRGQSNAPGQGQVIHQGVYDLANPQRPQHHAAGQPPGSSQNRGSEQEQAGGDRPRRRRTRNNERNEEGEPRSRRNRENPSSRSRREGRGRDMRVRASDQSNPAAVEDSLEEIEQQPEQNNNVSRSRPGAQGRTGSVAVQSLVQSQANQRAGAASRESRVHVISSQENHSVVRGHTGMSQAPSAMPYVGEDSNQEEDSVSQQEPPPIPSNYRLDNARNSNV